MRGTPYTWTLRLLWLSLPLTLGDLAADVLSDSSKTATVTGMVVMWVAWAAILLATLVLSPISLTFVRVVAPLAVAFAVVGATQVDPSALGWAGVAESLLVVAVTFSGDIGNDFVNGSSYGDERRLSLRAPAALLLGPVQVVWLICVGPLVVAVMLLGAGLWIAGAVLAVLGGVSAWWGFRIMHRLAGRWIVIVPAGLTVVDHLTLAEPTLFRRDSIRRLGPAPVGLDAVDLTAGAAGLIVSAELREPLSIVPTASRRGAVADPVDAAAVLLAPSRPGLLLELAQDHRIAVSRA